MRTRLLLRNVRRRVMITPVVMRSRLIRVRPSYWIIYRSFESILEWDCPLDWNFNPMFYANPLLQKIYNLICIIFSKILSCRGQLGL